MAKITGLGGVFYKAADPERSAAWYRGVLGVSGEWGIMFPWKQDDTGEAFSLLTAFKEASDYFAPSGKGFMINLRVDDLDSFVAGLEAKGVEIIGRQEEDYGKFAWILDCDGIKLELWQQLGPAPA